MSFTANHLINEPPRSEVDTLEGPLVIEFGTPWCGYCRAAQPLIAQAMRAHPGVQHMKVEDGKGRRLGRSFRVKLWPTLIFWKGGEEVGRVVRPDHVEDIASLLARIDTPNQDKE